VNKHRTNIVEQQITL